MSSRASELRTAGFTLIELIVALAIVAIISAVALTDSGNVASQSQIVSQVAVVKSHIHYVQMMAMKSNVSWGINFSSNSSYTLQKNGQTSTISFPSVGSATYTLPSGITVSSSANTVVFDGWGSPGASNITVTVSNGTTNTVITINMITGAVS
jgi:prepilin-type N-terminal cleavage/methylation domain-containing protein